MRGGDGVRGGCDVAEVAPEEAERVAGGESGVGGGRAVAAGVVELWLTVWSAGAVLR